MSEQWVGIAIFVAIVVLVATVISVSRISKLRKAKKYERGIKMVSLLIHLPPSTDDIDAGGRDKRDIADEAISKAQVMYSILSSTITKGIKTKLYGQRHFSMEIIAKDGIIRYYAIVPAVLTETVKQAVQSAYPTARIEEKGEENIFAPDGRVDNIAGAELTLQKEAYLPIATYEDIKRDASMAILNALSSVSKDEGAAVQVLFRPAQKNWFETGKTYIENVQKGKKVKTGGAILSDYVTDIIRAPWEVPGMHEQAKEEVILTNVKKEEIDAITNKMRYPGFETLIRIIACSATKPRSEAIVGGIVSAFSQFDNPEYNGFKVNTFKDSKKLAIDYTFRFFPLKSTENILNSIELASIFHLPEQNAIPNSQVERQLTKQVDGPAKLATDGVFLGTNEFRGNKKAIYLNDDDRRRHMYVIGQTGMGKSEIGRAHV